MRTMKRLRPRGQSLAIVIFGPSSLVYLRLCKPGYRHCLVATQDGGEWHLMDPLSNATEITRLGELHPEEILVAFRAKGLDAIVVQRRAPLQREMPLAPYTCVEAVKRVLGIRNRWVVTPWQLRKHLRHPLK